VNARAQQNTRKPVWEVTPPPIISGLPESVIRRGADTGSTPGATVATPPARPTASDELNRADLSPAQYDGLACIICGRDYLAEPIPHVPVGMVDGGQVFACTGCAKSRVERERR